jgi:hypothetical protein
MKGIARRFERIMDKYLIPAGFEIQKAQQEYERVLQGKALFDRDIVNLLDNAQSNNERYEILSGLRDYAIPNYDDLPAAYEGLKGPLLRAVKAERRTEPVPIETTYGNMEGFKPDAITKLVVEIVESLRYVDVDEINAANENEWFDLIARCAETKSNDLATFPVFGRFISKLAERKPEVADRFLAKASDDLRNFLAGFLNGLEWSGPEQPTRYL